MEESETSDFDEPNLFTWKDNEDVDSDGEMQGQSFPVAAFDIDSVDTTAIPLTSQEYLQQVIAERSRIPGVVTATVPKLETNVKKANLCIFLDEDIEESPHKPSPEWQQQQVSNFSNLRYRIECNKEFWEESSLVRLPNSKTEWFKFLFNQSSNEVVDILQQPYLVIVLQMNYGMMGSVVKYIVDWTSENSISIYIAGAWLFALLACIEVPLCIKVITKLREFVRLCREKRRNIDVTIEENKRELSAINLFICLIGKYFGQHDLCD